MERLKAADKDGLEVADYPVPDFSAATTPDDLANAELKLTASMLDYARQAQSGRVHWSRVSADIAYPDHPVDPTDVLVNITTARDASAALELLQSAAAAVQRARRPSSPNCAARPKRRRRRSTKARR